MRIGGDVLQIDYSKNRHYLECLLCDDERDIHFHYMSNKKLLLVLIVV